MSVVLQESPARVFRARRVITLDGPDVEALAVSGGRVLAVGSAAGVQSRFPDAEVIDLDGVVIPGLNDAHCHLAMASEDLLHLDLSPQSVGSHAELLGAIRREA
ncbi:MAG TPA: amidohydrolase family protein, partial [Nocardioidaceae bacterium]|nr:amidohydrolase family protein [Nocardioidaceae bacterium]